MAILPLDRGEEGLINTGGSLEKGRPSPCHTLHCAALCCSVLTQLPGAPSNYPPGPRFGCEWSECACLLFPPSLNPSARTPLTLPTQLRHPNPLLSPLLTPQNTHPLSPKAEQFYPLLWRDVHVCPRIVWQPGHGEQPQWAQNTLPSCLRKHNTARDGTRQKITRPIISRQRSARCLV